MRGIDNRPRYVRIQAGKAHIETRAEEEAVLAGIQVDLRIDRRFSGQNPLRAAIAIAPSKQADQPAAKSCSGLVPSPGPPGVESLMSSLPSELREEPSRPPVV